MLWAQINSFVIYMLLAASIISALLGDYVELSLFWRLWFSMPSWVSSRRARPKLLGGIEETGRPESSVLRDGHRISVPAAQLVPGDIVFLEAGNYIPADVRLLEAVNLRVDEASLTGESLPVEKNAQTRLEADIPLGDRKNTAFMGTLVNYGRGKGVVVPSVWKLS